MAQPEVQQEVTVIVAPFSRKAHGLLLAVAVAVATLAVLAAQAAQAVGLVEVAAGEGLRATALPVALVVQVLVDWCSLSSIRNNNRTT